MTSEDTQAIIAAINRLGLLSNVDEAYEKWNDARARVARLGDAFLAGWNARGDEDIRVVMEVRSKRGSIDEVAERSEFEQVIELPSEEHKPCPSCGEMAAVIDVDTTACTQCGRTIRSKT